MDQQAAQDLIQKDKEERQEKEKADRQIRLNLIAMLTPEAKDRLDRLALVNKEKAEAVTDLILKHADSGFVSQRISDEQMKEFLEIVNSKQTVTGKVTIHRKRYGEDDDDSDDYADL